MKHFVLAGTTPTIIGTEEAVKQSFVRKGKETQSIDLAVEHKYRPHPAEAATVTVGKEDGNETIQIYTDGSRNGHGVGAGVAMFSGNELVTTLKYRLDNRCSKNQAEQLPIANDNYPNTEEAFVW